MTKIKILYKGDTNLEYDPKAVDTDEYRMTVREVMEKLEKGYTFWDGVEGSMVSLETVGDELRLPDTDHDLYMLLPISGG